MLKNNLLAKYKNILKEFTLCDVRVYTEVPSFIRFQNSIMEQNTASFWGYFVKCLEMEFDVA